MPTRMLMRNAWLFLLACVSLSSPLDAQSRWDGTWKLNPDRSQLTGETFSYVSLGGGKWKVQNGGPIAVTFATDGKPYRSFSDDETVSATQEGPKDWTLRRQYKGQTWDVTHETFSADGNTLTSSEVATNPDGTTTHVTTIQKRVGSGTGFEGKWQSTQIMGRYQSGWVFANRFQFTSTGPGTMRWSMPDDQMTLDVTLDGRPVQLGGPTDRGKVFFRVTRVSDQEFYVAVWRDGKEERDYRMKLAKEGKTFTDSSWAPGKSSGDADGGLRERVTAWRDARQ